MSPQQKHTALAFVKYAPSVLALTCSAKIMLLSMSCTSGDEALFAVNWVNLILNLLMLAAVYILGRCFNFCWRHKASCLLALVGYVGYGISLATQSPKQDTLDFAVKYLAAVFVLTLIFHSHDIFFNTNTSTNDRKGRTSISNQNHERNGRGEYLPNG